MWTYSDLPLKGDKKTSIVLNAAIFEYKFPDELKEANVSPVYKADDKTLKLNYKPTSINHLLLKYMKGS